MKVIQFTEKEFNKLFDDHLKAMELSMKSAEADMSSHDPNRFKMDEVFRSFNFHLRSLQGELKA